MDYVCKIPKEFCSSRNEDNTCRAKLTCEPIVEQCKGEDKSCNRIENGFCIAYIKPSVKWKADRKCPLATHIADESVKQKAKRRIGQQKQRKG